MLFVSTNPKFAAASKQKQEYIWYLLPVESTVGTILSISKCLRRDDISD